MEVFTGSMARSAVVVVTVYGAMFFASDVGVLKRKGGIELVVAGSLAAFLGAFIGMI